MVTVWGAPGPFRSFPLTVKMGTLWDDCVQDCVSRPSCMLAYGNSSLLCALYHIGDVQKIRNDKEASESLEKVSFKIATTDKCSRDQSGMFDGNSNIFPATFTFSYEIKTSEDFYNLNLISALTISTCEWQFGPDIECSGCPRSMMVFRGTLLFIDATREPTITTWYDCIAVCYARKWCAGAVMNGEASCYLFPLDKFPPFERTEDLGPQSFSTGHSYLALKFLLPSSNCPPTFTSLFSGAYESDGLYSTSFSSYKLVTVDSQTTIEYKIRNKTMCDDHYVYVLNNFPGCFDFFRESVTYDVAVQRCEAMGGDGLMAIPANDTLPEIEEAKDYNKFDNGFYFVGFTRADENSEWKWTIPYLTYDDSVYNRSIETLKGPGLYASLDFYNWTLHVHTISTRIDNEIEHQMIAVIYPTHLYVTRKNLQSGCVTILADPGYTEYRFGGVFGGGAWIGDDLMLWFSKGAESIMPRFNSNFLLIIHVPIRSHTN